MTTTAVSKDKLDAPQAGANGPESEFFADWDSIDWDRTEGNVRRLRQRIFTASRDGDLAKVRNLQKLMFRSLGNTLMSVRRVTEVNAGRKTAGVDGHVALNSASKTELARFVAGDGARWRARPVRRVFIPKNGSRSALRPLGIPVIIDRCHQARAANALEPEWEARFEARSYGFRAGRGCHDAIGVIYNTLSGGNAKRVWILDADLAAAFDRIDHEHLLAELGTFPARDLVREWLKAGVVDRGQFTRTEEGTPQGGLISPVLLNVALHGMETAAGVRYHPTGRHAGETASGSPVLVRYADDLVVMCHSREAAEQVKARLAAWLTPRGLVFNENKTRVVHAETGFDFLGFTVRRFRGKLLIKPSKEAVGRVRKRLHAEMRALRGAPPGAVLRRLNPIIRGWAAYYRTVVSKEIFTSLDHYLWQLTYRWALRRHPKKPKRWVVDRYFGRFNPARQDRWVFGDRVSGAYLVRFTWTKIIRHQLVKGTASPDDPALTDYWAARRRRSAPPPADRATLRLLREQNGRCPLCGHLLLHAENAPQSPQGWERWLRTTRTAMKTRNIATGALPTPDGVQPRLTHTTCLRRGRKLLRTHEPSGLA
ncbi:group II intron reverse transcriptase/maturase [Nocardia cyriacigeorgica]|uniref:group II intron reverse transcriptase/maturase n=1 Tax=Nocardia cyriacigeorgica TaxID=135487 RepID=UPI002157D812|nr:group II intron reverse transcriptase/maturase [Nocardia cyriacigeorgica]